MSSIPGSNSMVSPIYVRKGMRSKRPKISPLPSSVTKRAFNCIRSHGAEPIDERIQSSQQNGTPTIEHTARLLRLSEEELERAFGLDLSSSAKRPKHAFRHGAKSNAKRNEDLFTSRPAFDCSSPTHFKSKALSPVRRAKNTSTSSWDPKRAYGSGMIADKVCIYLMFYGCLLYMTIVMYQVFQVI
jgi:hypothetical protein